MRVVVRNNQLDQARAAALLADYGATGVYTHGGSVYSEVPDGQVAVLASAFNAKLRPQLGASASLGLCVVQSLPEMTGKKLGGGLQQDAAFKAFASGEGFSLQLQSAKKLAKKPKAKKAKEPKPKEAKPKEGESKPKPKEAKPKAKPKAKEGTSQEGTSQPKTSQPKTPKEHAPKDADGASTPGPKPKPKKKKRPVKPAS